MLTGTPLITETNGQIEVHKYEVPLHGLCKYFWYPLMRFFERVLFSNSHAILVDGNQRLSVFKNRYPNWDKRFHLVRSGGIDLDRFRIINKNEARKQLGLPMDKRILVWVGTFFDFSGLEILFQAIPRICEQLADVEFLIIGDGDSKAHYIEKVKEYGLSDRVRFTGYIANQDLYRWLSASDLALAPYNRLRLGQEDSCPGIVRAPGQEVFEYGHALVGAVGGDQFIGPFRAIELGDPERGVR